MIAKVGIMLNRAPIILPRLSELKSDYLRFKECTNSERARPFIKDFYFRRGTAAEKEWDDAQKSGGLSQPMQVVHTFAPIFKTDEFQSLERKMDKNLYFCWKTNINDSWHLPDGEIKSNELLLEAAKGKLSEYFGNNIEYVIFMF
jgi:hypothetical protein